MSDIYLETLVYDKPTIDSKFTTESTRVDIELAKKAEKINIGAPGGIATLSSTGKHNTLEVPFCTNTEAYEGTRSDVIIAPSTLKYAVEIGQVSKASVGVANGVCPLDSSTKINASFLPPLQNITTYVVDTLIDMYALQPVALTGDRCVVTSDPNDIGGNINGEYVAEVDYPSSSQWKIVPNFSAVQSVNGMTGTVDIVTTVQGNTNAISIITWGSKTDTNTSNIASLTGRVTATENDVITLESALLNTQNSLNALDAEVELNATNIGLLDQRIDTLEANVPFSPIFLFNIEEDITILNDNYQQVSRLTTSTALPAGTYILSASADYTLNSTNSSAFLRISLDGGNTWMEHISEPKDTTDAYSCLYYIPITIPTQVVDIITQGRKEVAGNIMVVTSCRITIERKL